MEQEITAAEKALLREIGDGRRYPVVCFELRSSREPSLRSVALREVHMETGRETMEEVKARRRAAEKSGAKRAACGCGMVCLSRWRRITRRTQLAASSPCCRSWWGRGRNEKDSCLTRLS